MESHFIEFLASIFAKPIIQDAYNLIKTLFVKSKIKIEEKEQNSYDLQTDFEEFSECYEKHLNEINLWSIDTNLNNNFKPISQVYVKLKFYLNPKRTHLFKEEPKKIELTEILKNDKHIVIYGGPGTGKSTSMRFLCQEIFNNEKLFHNSRTPIVIRFRELNPKWGEVWSLQKCISKKILDEFGIKIIDSKKQSKIEDDFLEYFKVASKLLDGLNSILILDGFDEISSTDQKIFYSEEIYKLSINLKVAKFIITSRTGDFNIDLANTHKYEIAPLSKDQIKEYIINWLEDEKQSNDLFNQINNSPYFDTAARPLTLSQLCAIYDKSPNKKIPEKPKSIYSLVVHLLIKEWNENSRVNRVSKYSSFEVDRKEDFLYNLSYLLTVKYNTIKFNKELLKEVYKILANNFSLPLNEVDSVLDELESHNGLFVQSGFDEYEFSHLSLQEYLTAKYIVSIGTIPPQVNILEKIPYSLAIATVISANQTEYFYNLVYNTLNNLKISSKFISVYLDRLYVEKPDFSISPIVPISILTLLNNNIKIINKETKGNGVKISEQLNLIQQDYEKIFELSIVSNSLREISLYYEYKKNVTITKYNLNDAFIRLKRIKLMKDDFNSYKIENELIIPLWVSNYMQIHYN